MIKVGSIVLTIWSTLNFLVGVGVLFYIVVFDNNAPALQMLFSENEISNLNPRVLAATNSIAIFLNASIASYCLLCIYIIWHGLYKKQKWSYYGLLLSMGLMQIGGYLSDSLLGNNNILAMNIGLAILVLGFALSGYAIFTNEKELKKI